MSKPCGLFITGTDTGVGKTYVGARIARDLVAAGHRVGVYKPVESGCRPEGSRAGDPLIAQDARTLWEAAGRPGTLQHVCPQRFAAPLAPHLAARAEGSRIDADLLLGGIKYWYDRADILLVEGAGGLMSPLAEDWYNADLAFELGMPLVVVTRNALGTINHTLSTLIVAATFRDGLDVAGVVLNQPTPEPDQSAESNLQELQQRCVSPILAQLRWEADQFDRPVDWFSLANRLLK